MHVLLWQLADSGFPAGAFAHSAGLEAAWQEGEVSSPVDLRRFVRDALAQAGRGMLPLLSAAHRQPDRIEPLDRLCDAFLSNAVANRASRSQGRAFLTTCVRAFGGSGLDALDLEVRRAELGAHHAPVFGAALRLLDVPILESQRLWLYSTCRGTLSAAVRLGLIGPIQAQAMQRECTPDIEAIRTRCEGLGEADIAQTAPVIDLLQSMHDRLYSRLFQS
jgi:urease accessory protein